MRTKISEVIVFGNSNAFGSEIGTRFTSLEECVAAARRMQEPDINSWPSLLNQMGIRTKNHSKPGSGFLPNVAGALKSFVSSPSALYLIEISLFDHLSDEVNTFRSKNSLLFSTPNVERHVLQLCIQDQIFILNEVRKLLHQMSVQFKFFSAMNPFVDYSGIELDPERKNYAQFLRSTALKPFPDIPPEIRKDILLGGPYFGFFDESEVSEFCHLTSISSVNTLAKMIHASISEQYEVAL